MSETTEAVYAFLDGLGIDYRRDIHGPTASMEDCAGVDRHLGTLTPKNIFLAPKNGRAYYLCITRPAALFRTSDISRQAGSARLSYAPEEKMIELLRARGGSASPLGLIFDRDHRVKLLVDSALTKEPTLGFHPCDNTETVVMAQSDFFSKFLPAVGVCPQFVEIHHFMNPVGPKA